MKRQIFQILIISLLMLFRGSAFSQSEIVRSELIRVNEYFLKDSMNCSMTQYAAIYNNGEEIASAEVERQQIKRSDSYLVADSIQMRVIRQDDMYLVDHGKKQIIHVHNPVLQETVHAGLDSLVNGDTEFTDVSVDSLPDGMLDIKFTCMPVSYHMIVNTDTGQLNHLEYAFTRGDYKNVVKLDLSYDAFVQINEYSKFLNSIEEDLSGGLQKAFPEYKYID